MPDRPLRLAPEWDDRFTGMVVVSAVAHAVVIAATIWVLAQQSDERPLPLVAYTVEVTDPSALGGRLPPGVPGKPLTGGPTAPPSLPGRPEPAAAKPESTPPEPAEARTPPKPAEPPPVEKPPEPKPAEAKPPEPPPPPEPKPAEAKPPVPKPEEPTVSVAPKPTTPEPKKVEPPKPEPQAAKPEPPKPVPEPKKPEPAKSETAKAEPPRAAPAKPEPPKPEARSATNGKDASAPAGKEGAPRDDYSAAAERWRSRSEKQGGGVGGTDGRSGPIGAGGEGPGGGGQLVGIDFLAYRQRVINTVKAQWTNVIARPGLVTVVRFEIAPDGEVGTIKIERSSGNPAYDASAMRAVQRANPLPAPPSRYAHEFGEFLIEFHSEEQGGQGAG